MRLCIPAIAAFCILIGAPAAAQEVCPQADSAGPPIVHNQHIFCGEVSGNPLRAKGFHSRPGGANPASITNTAPPVPVPGAPPGVYELRGFNITQGVNTRVKARSTMFPDNCHADEVLAAIRNAAQGAVAGGVFHGASGNQADHCHDDNGHPINIVGYTNANGDILTAWPDYPPPPED